MKFSLDGGLTFQEASEGIRVIYEDMDIPGEDVKGELHITLTPEGVIKDLWCSRMEDELDFNAGTSSKTTGEIIEQLLQ